MMAKISFRGVWLRRRPAGGVELIDLGGTTGYRASRQN
jgi:hypothetical protein